MSVEQLESQVLALPLAERRAFTRWLDEHRDEIEQPSVLIQAQAREVRQRLAEMEADPSLCVPFAEADVKQMFKEILDERAAKHILSYALTSATPSTGTKTKSPVWAWNSPQIFWPTTGISLATRSFMPSGLPACGV